ncbi:MAG: ATP-binding cassette domain-containing protein [Actinobacteria bacterium]|nr:ATP-binding cassette domain-containing protein [Actinomycetota bacterium]
MSEPEPVIKLENLVKRFGQQTVLDGINLEVYPGETMVIMGGSGCGKSTLLRIMIGSIKPTSGKVIMLGQSLAQLSESEIDELRKKIGILFQSGALFNSMTVGENVALPLREHTKLHRDVIDLQVTIKLNQVSLLQARDKMPAQISGGMKKRAGLARALAMDPQILFYDEPSAGLDPVTSSQIDELIMNLSKGLGVTSVVVTHEMDSAFRIADRMCMLNRGKVLKVATREEFEALRDVSDADGFSQDELLMRQFLRGDPEGPISSEEDKGGFFEELGIFSLR